MAERDGFPPGTFCWVDLSAADQEGAKSFYTALFGWEVEDLPAGDGVYSMMRIDGRAVAAISAQPRKQRDAGVPPVWNSYVAVESADETASRAGKLGANVHAGPFDVFEAGRMAVIQDPLGAYFLLWEPRGTKGVELVNAPGALVWNELASPDMEVSARFYTDLFGWSIEPSQEPGPPYLMISNHGSYNGGIRNLEPAGTPPHWLVYFDVASLDDSLKRLGELGGVTIAGPIDIGRARVAVVEDLQGAVFALYDGDVE